MFFFGEQKRKSTHTRGFESEEEEEEKNGFYLSLLWFLQFHFFLFFYFVLFGSEYLLLQSDAWRVERDFHMPRAGGEKRFLLFSTITPIHFYFIFRCVCECSVLKQFLPNDLL